MSETAPMLKNPIEYELNADDLTAYAIAHYKLSPATVRQRRISFVVSLSLLSAIPVLLAISSAKPFGEAIVDVWPFVLAPFIYVVLGPWMIKRRTVKIVRRMMQEGEANGSYGPHRFSWNSDGVSEQSERGATVRKWESIERIVQSKSHIFIYTSGVEAFVVPVRVFQSEAETDAFVKDVASHTKVEPIRSI